MSSLCIKTVRWMSIAAAACVLLAACANNPATTLPSLESPGAASQGLQPGDQVRVVVFGQEDLPTEYVVDDRGFISLPLVGPVQAGGMSAQELEQQLTERYTRVLVDPSVNVQVLSERPVYVLGGVNEPGAYPYSKNMTVMSVAAMANGFTPFAYEDYFKVTRTGSDGRQQDFRVTGKDLIQPDDIIYVYEQYKEY